MRKDRHRDYLLDRFGQGTMAPDPLRLQSRSLAGTRAARVELPVRLQQAAAITIRVRSDLNGVGAGILRSLARPTPSG